MTASHYYQVSYKLLPASITLDGLLSVSDAFPTDIFIQLRQLAISPTADN